jgi:hypothetical protein
MDTRKRSSHSRDARSGKTSDKGRAKKAGAALREHVALYGATENFIRGNSNFESAHPINAVVDAVAACTNFATLFATPLQHKLFTMESALRWVLFLNMAPARAAQEDDCSFSPEAPFNAGEALTLLAGVYDIGVQEVVWELFEAEEEDEEDGSGEDDDH